MNHLISIIVPIYNSEKYIERCLKSILEQRYKNIEIIIINDGSTDESLTIVDKFQDNRIKCFSKVNEGVSIARNYGMDKATGDYLLFIDSDDYVTKYMVEKLVSGIKDNSTLVLCNNYEVWKDRKETRMLFQGIEEVDKRGVMREIASGRAGLVCCKLISRKIVKDNNIYFDENLQVGEDQLFFLKIAKCCENFSYLSEALYFYDRTNENSATIKYQGNLFENFMYLYKETERFFISNGLNSDEDKKILGDKLLAIVWTCANNEVNNLRKSSLKKCKNQIAEILEKSYSEFKYPFETNRLNNKLAKLLNKKSKKQAAVNIIIIVTILNLKMKVRNKISYGSKG